MQIGEKEVDVKVDQLAEWIRGSKHTVIYTGAGVSTSAGIPDFRGPKGVWTLEEKGEKPDMNISWDDAKPTSTHMAIAKLAEEDKCKFVISQNIDGLHLRSGLPRSKLAELHGNMFVDECSVCKKMFVRSSAAPTVGRKMSEVSCKAQNRRPCRGKLRDFVLDWEDELPDEDLSLSHSHSMLSELSIVIGSTLQIIPAGNMPTFAKKNGKGILVIVNLQPTKHDKKADLIIRAFADKVFEKLFSKLGLKIPSYAEVSDPVKRLKMELEATIDWSQSNGLAKEWEKKCSKLEAELKKQRKVEKERKSREEFAIGQKQLQAKLKQEKLQIGKAQVKEENEDQKPPPVKIAKTEKDIKTEGTNGNGVHAK